mgnify:CR=1 FL=1
MEGSFSLFDLRIFGQGDGKVPVAVTSFQATRDENDKRIYRFVWDSQENVTGYIYVGEHRKKNLPIQWWFTTINTRPAISIGIQNIIFLSLLLMKMVSGVIK